MCAANIWLDADLSPVLGDAGDAFTLDVDAGVHAASFPSQRVAEEMAGWSDPEAARSLRVSLRDDVYSVGVLLLTLLTGLPARDTKQPVALLADRLAPNLASVQTSGSALAFADKAAGWSDAAAKVVARLAGRCLLPMAPGASLDPRPTMEEVYAALAAITPARPQAAPRPVFNAQNRGPTSSSVAPPAGYTGGAPAPAPPPPVAQNNWAPAPASSGIRQWWWGPGADDRDRQPFVAYDPGTNKEIEIAYQSALAGGPIVHTITGGVYVVDFSTMKQVKRETGYARDLKTEPYAAPVAGTGVPAAGRERPTDNVDRESGVILRQWAWNGPGPVGPSVGYTNYDYDQNTEIELAYRAYRKQSELFRVRIMGDVRGVKSDGKCLPDSKHPVYDVDFKKMVQINPASNFERP